jgi:phosphatidylglycerophosphatase A
MAPTAPGTAGSLVGLLIGLPLLSVSPPLLFLATLAATLGGILAIQSATGQRLRARPGDPHDDPGWIVIDEIAGQMLTLLALHRISLTGIALAFALFRLFDISKLGPIGWIDRQGGAIAIMADDILAALAACALLLVLQGLGVF